MREFQRDKGLLPKREAYHIQMTINVWISVSSYQFICHCHMLVLITAKSIVYLEIVCITFGCLSFAINSQIILNLQQWSYGSVYVYMHIYIHSHYAYMYTYTYTNTYNHYACFINVGAVLVGEMQCFASALYYNVSYQHKFWYRIIGHQYVYGN